MQITPELLEKFKSDFEKCPANEAAAGAVARVGFQQAAFNNEVLRRHNFCFSDETKRGEITAQKSSGRCWMFSSLNVARVKVMEKLNMESFEFSESYHLFWDKLERANFFLENILETLEEPSDGRLLTFLLQTVAQDGGQWDMFSGLLQKYGAVPKQAMPETFHSSDTAVLISLVARRLRKAAQVLRSGFKAGKKIEELRKEKENFLSEIYNILVKAVGAPPSAFDFEYYDKDKKFHKIEALTPKTFFEKYVGWNLDDKVGIISAPDKEYGRAYTAKFVGSVKEGGGIKYVNVPMEEMKKIAVASIKAGEPVWFACDVGKFCARKEGILDLDVYNYDAVAGKEPEFTRAERLEYRESLPTHAMVITGVDLDSNGNPIKWQIENSWGDELGKKGIFSMSDRWFDEYTYQITADKKFVDKKTLEAFEKPFINMEPWDPWAIQ